MPFNLSGKADISHINIRKGTADDATVSVDIKFDLEGVSSATAAAALGADSPEDVEHAFFRPVSQDADRNSQFLGLKWIECEASWEDKHAITIKGFRRVRAHKVNKIHLKPRANGKFDLKFSVTLEQPPQGYVENLAEHLNSALQIDLEHDAELALERPKNEPAPKQTSLLKTPKKPGRPKKSQ